MELRDTSPAVSRLTDGDRNLWLGHGALPLRQNPPDDNLTFPLVPCEPCEHIVEAHAEEAHHVVGVRGQTPGRPRLAAPDDRTGCPS